MCGRNGISKWDAVDAMQVEVYMSKSHIGDANYLVKTRNCRTCGIEFDILTVNGGYHTVRKCECGGKAKILNLAKLEVYFDTKHSKMLLAEYNMSKTKGFNNTERYWLNAGKTKEEAEILSREEQGKRSAKSPAAQKGVRGYSVRTVEYWIKKGFSLEESKVKVSESQVKNGLEWSIATYGEIEGPIKFNDRMDDWHTKMAVAVKHGISQISLDLLSKVDDGRNGFFGPTEKVVRGVTRSHRVDYLYGKSIIEFQGDYWHANPLKYSGDEILIGKKVASDIWEKDANKVRDLIAKGYDVLIVWEDEFKREPEKTINKCKQFLDKNNNENKN